MGANFAVDLANDEGLSLRASIGIHLQSNHYPPVPVAMVSACIYAIDACNDGDPTELIALPVGVSWKGSPEAPAWAIVEAHHLDAWIEGEAE